MPTSRTKGNVTCLSFGFLSMFVHIVVLYLRLRYLILVHVLMFVCRQFETVIPDEDSVITEMTSTLRDWGAMWKQLYVVRTLTHNHTCTLCIDLLSLLLNWNCNVWVHLALGNSESHKQSKLFFLYAFISRIDCVCGLLDYLGCWLNWADEYV